MPNRKKIFSCNLLHQLEINKKTQKEVAEAIGVSPQTFNTWCQGIALPRMGKIQLLADYFGIEKSALIEKQSTEKSEMLEELDGVYLSLAQEAQKSGVSPDDIKLAIEMIRKFRGE